VLARWSGWGSLPGVFDPSDGHWADARTDLAERLSGAEWQAAERTTLNAHYTPVELAGVMWDTVLGLGFDGGRVLEPGCGAGTFLGTAPKHLDLDLIGVELDPITARIAAALYPHATVRAEGFERSQFAEGSFDLVIGNVPFGQVALHDPTHNRSRLSIHNHFLLKGLHLTRPGGLVACLTSRYTLDAQALAARSELAVLGDLVGAVRLPAGAFRAVAGTDVVIDLVLLRRRHEHEAPAGPAWLHTRPVDTDSGPVEINEVFATHPDWVLGDLANVHGQYNDHDLTVRPTGDGPLATDLAGVLTGITATAVRDGLAYQLPTTPRTGAPVTRSVEVDVEAWHKEGSLLTTPTGLFARVEAGVPRPYMPTPRKDTAELRALVRLRDSLYRLLDLESAGWDDTAPGEERARLNDLYDDYSARYGPLNRFRLARTGRQDPATGAEQYRRLLPRMGGFNQDPDLPSVRALEDFDPDTGTATKAAIFTRRVVGPRTTPTTAESPQDALAVCLDRHGHPDLDTIAGLLGVDPPDARQQLDQLVFDDPATGQLVTATDYLAGNVRQKLADARAAAVEDPRFGVNVAALEGVQPRDLEPEEIDARLGAPWIDASDVAAFVSEVLACGSVLVEHAPIVATWTLTAAVGARRTVAMTSEWGTGRVDALHLVEASCNQRAMTVYDEHDDGTRTVNTTETLAAREKQEALGDRFATWVWEDPDRATRLARLYNERFNSTVLPVYDGSHLTFPGLSQAFQPHPHQRDAVWRIVSEPTTLLAHAVGAGKTATMAMAGMELRRLGLARKPAYVVPNHMLEQFSREFLQLYPQARILLGDKEQVSPARRKEFVARCATGDWDAVVLTYPSFERLAVSHNARVRFLESRMEEFREAIAASEAGAKLSVKKLQLALTREEQRHERLLADQRRDDGICFEATGIDYLFVDEAHSFKNLHFATRIQGVSSTGSQRAEDLLLKLETLRSDGTRRVATLATATPIANSIAEMYVMQTYLQPDTLRAAGVDTFDAWAANFGRTVTALELAPDGSSYRMHSRFARFANVPELLRMFRAVADVQTPEQLNLDTPALVGDTPETVIVPPSPELQRYVEDLVRRAEDVRNRSVRPEEDNMLKVSGDGRRAALHLALVDQTPDPDHGKLTAAADRIAHIAQATATRTYRTVAGETSPRTGALQLVFCDLGTPNAAKDWNVYSQLRTLLAERGVPAEQVRFIHDAKHDRAKAELFAACRDGRVRVLVGSTEKMGVGTNVQDRVAAIHHLDCPWRPADIEQRDGRGLRQGNQHEQIEIVRYVTEGSFDIYLWQTVERKAGFIHQVMRGDVTGRHIDDIGEQALSYAEVKALATGNPLILEKAGIEAELGKLQRLEANHRDDQVRLARTRTRAEQRVAHLDTLADAFRQAIRQRQDTHGDRFQMTVGTTTFDERAEGGDALRQAAMRSLQGLLPGHPRDSALGKLGGFSLLAHAVRDTDGAYVELSLDGIPGSHVQLTRTDLRETTPGGLIARFEHRLHDLERRLSDTLAEADQARTEVANAAGRIDKPFPHHERISSLRSRLEEIDALLVPLDSISKPDIATASVALPAQPDRGDAIGLR
jgi:N12 class adenine-specific DNA methylase